MMPLQLICLEKEIFQAIILSQFYVPCAAVTTVKCAKMLWRALLQHLAVVELL